MFFISNNMLQDLGFDTHRGLYFTMIMGRYTQNRLLSLFYLGNRCVVFSCKNYPVYVHCMFCFSVLFL